MSLQTLLSIPDPVRQTEEVLAGLDRCFLIGFGRLGPEQHDALRSLTRICAGTPLGQPVEKAVAALGRSEFLDRHFVVLAAARAALQAAQYDALREQARTALGRPTAAAPPPDGGGSPGKLTEESGPIGVWQESARNWLMELALAGFQQLEAQTIFPFLATLEQLQGEPRTIRLAALLTGFLNELLDSMPVSALPAIPLYRWADLWTRGMLASAAPPLPPAGRKVSGRFTFLGADLHTHGFFVSCDCYGLLEETGGANRIARLTLSAYKVSVVDGSDLWSCLPNVAGDPLRGLSQHLTFQIDDMTLLPGGDLLWDGKATAKGESAFLNLTQQKFAPGADQAPQGLVCSAQDRHPVHLAELVFLGPYQVVKGNELQLDLGDGVQLPVAVKRMCGGAELQPVHVPDSRSMLGLLRFDGGRWEVQPLAVIIEGKKAEVRFTGMGAAAAHSGRACAGDPPRTSQPAAPPEEIAACGLAGVQPGLAKPQAAELQGETSQ